MGAFFLLIDLTQVFPRLITFFKQPPLDELSVGALQGWFNGILYRQFFKFGSIINRNNDILFGSSNALNAC